ncbi:MAG: class I SAM-dependent methyltransferase [Geitlerinemataceae cyanobacterium]
MEIELPYFDMLLDAIAQGDRDTIDSFGTHVHWGYWPEPYQADGTVADFASAAKRLSECVYEAGGIKNGDRVLDAGCGFGGTTGCLNERYENLHVTGLNIDRRQLDRAESLIKPINNNAIDWICANACELPFPDNSFDRVLAVECIFHFPSREQFMREVKRVLKPGGTLALSDFMLWPIAVPLFKVLNFFASEGIQQLYGDVGSTDFTVSAYRRLATSAGLTLETDFDITRKTLPTYPVLKEICRRFSFADAERVVEGQERASKFGLVRYIVLSFRSPS